MIKSLGKVSQEEVGMYAGSQPQDSAQPKNTIGNPLSLLNMDPKFQPILKSLSPVLNSKAGLEVGNKLGETTRKGSDFLRGTPGAYAIPQAAADIFELTRNGTPGENPFRSEEQNLRTRDINNPMEAIKDVGKEAASVASMTYVPGAASRALSATNISQGMQYSHPIIEGLLRSMAAGGATGTAAGLGTENVSPGKVAGTAATYAILAPLMQLLFGGLGSKGQLYKKLENSAKGSEIKSSLRDVETEAKSALQERMGSDYTLKSKEANKILSQLIHEKGNPLIEPRDMSAADLLQWRGELSKASGRNYLQKLLGSSINPSADVEAKTSDALRSVVSARFKEAVPQARLADALYSMYSNPLIGQPISWIPRAVGGAAAAKTVGSLTNLF